MKYIDDLIIRRPNLKNIKNDIENFYKELLICYKNGNKVLICGNGGSSADSAHITGELMKSFIKTRNIDNDLQLRIKNVFNYLDDKKSILDKNEKYTKMISTLEVGLPTIDLTAFTALHTAFSNDKNYEYIFANDVNAFAKVGDVVIAISTSGNSKNIVNACIVAKAKGIKVLSLTGNDGGMLKYLSDVIVCSNEKECYLIQEDHLSIYHSVCLQLEDDLF